MRTGLLVIFGILMLMTLMYSITSIWGIPLFLALLGGFVLIVYFFKKEQKYICGYCNFVAESERELHNHSLNCENFKLETNIKKFTPLDILKE